ncbi:MAG: UPF0149 family protein [Gammaproteobacteria bacterium]|nr:UPF0149 family protein [Gammaproteobacteria bacterium]
MNTGVDRYTQLEAVLDLAGIEISASEAHGTVVGAVANHLQSGQSPDLMGLLAPGTDTASGAMAQASETLYDLYRATSSELLEGAEGYSLLLPHEDEPLNTRVEGLAAWARGYLLGLLYNNAFSIDQLPESGPEIGRDLMQIADAGASLGDDTEREEDWALAELQEYVKVGSQLIFEFIYSARASETPEAQQ